MLTVAKSESTPFAQRLRALRRAAGLTQKKVAEDLQIGYQTYLRWERGETEPNFTELRALASLFGVELNDFIPIDE